MTKAVRIINQVQTVLPNHILRLKDLTAPHPDHQHHQEVVTVAAADHPVQEAAAVEDHQAVADIGGNKQ